MNDEELFQLWTETCHAEVDRFLDEGGEFDKCAGVRAIRKAIGTIPEIPDGWQLESIGDCQEELDGDVIRTYYACTIYNKHASREGIGPTWQESMADAISKVDQ